MMWRRRPHHLPFSEGPYVPGSFDLMTEYSPEGCFARIYYPTSHSNIQSFTNKWIPWLPDHFYLDAFAYVINVWSFIVKLVFKFFAGDTMIPVVWESDFRKGDEKYPVVVFSHGLGASRFIYSCICCELASHGFVVAAVEHRENSACSTFYYTSCEDRNLLKPTKIKYNRISRGWNHHKERQEQVRKRSAECQKVVDLLKELNAGNNVENILRGNFNLLQLKNRLDLSRLTMMGHSFGGATALKVLGEDHRFRAGVILDGWMFPLKDDEHLPSQVIQPLLFINTQTFQIPVNVAVMDKFMKDGPAKYTERLGYTIRRTTHEHQTDTPFIVGCWLNLFMRKLDCKIAMDINNQLILKFLQKHIDVPTGINNSILQKERENIVEALSV